MAKYYIPVAVRAASGTQTYIVEADSPKHALALYKKNKAELFGEELYVDEKEEPELDDIYQD